MQFTVTVDQESTSSELSALSVFIHNVACLRGNAAPVPVPQEVVNNAPVQTVVVSPEVSTPAEEPTEAPKRKPRRTTAAQESETVQPADAPAEGSVEQAVVKMPEEVTSPAPTEVPTPVPTEPAVATPVVAAADVVEVEVPEGKVFTQPEVQMLASDAARRVGPDKVKGLIAEFGAARIADLSGDKLNQFAVRVQALA
jgi:hypothetical protein